MTHRSMILASMRIRSPHTLTDNGIISRLWCFDIDSSAAQLFGYSFPLVLFEHAFRFGHAADGISRMVKDDADFAAFREVFRHDPNHEFVVAINGG